MPWKKLATSLYTLLMDNPPDNLAKYLADKLVEVGLNTERATKLSAEIIKTVNLEIIRLAHDSLQSDQRPVFESRISSAPDEQAIQAVLATTPGLEQEKISRTAIDNTYLKIEHLLSTHLTPTQLANFRSLM